MANRAFFHFFTLPRFLLMVPMLLLPAFLSAQVELFIKSTINLVDKKEPQFNHSQTYKLSGKTLYKVPGSFLVRQGQTYRFDLHFEYDHYKENLNKVTLSEYLKQGGTIKLGTSTAKKIVVKSEAVNVDTFSFTATVLSEHMSRDTLHLLLLDKSKNLFSDIRFALQVRPNDNSPIYTTTNNTKPPELLLKLRRQEIATARPLIKKVNYYGQDTITIRAEQAFSMEVGFEEVVVNQGKSYPLSANYQQDLGYRLSYKWLGQGLTFRQGTQNGFQSFLTAKPAPITRKISESRAAAAAAAEREAAAARGGRAGTSPQSNTTRSDNRVAGRDGYVDSGRSSSTKASYYTLSINLYPANAKEPTGLYKITFRVLD